MRAGGEHVYIHLIWIYRDLTECLNGICMKEDSILMCQLTYLSYRFYRSYLVICCHYRDKSSVVSYSVFY